MTTRIRIRLPLLAIILVGLYIAVTEVSGGAEDARSSAMVGFCENNFYIPRSKKSCAHGFNFGKRAPKCICIKGIYRMYLSSCEVADGFAEEVCTQLTDPENQITVHGVKLTKEPRWDKTALVCERGTGTNKDWEYVTEFGKARTFANSFYTIHGDAFTSVVSDGKQQQQICVQRSMKDSNTICLYKHHDNIPDWIFGEKSIEIIVKTECPSDSEWKPMKANKCFDPLTLLDSECQVPCSKANVQEGGLQQSFAVNEEAYLDKDVVNPKPYTEHDNSYLDRKLNTYWVLQEIGVVNVTPINTINHGPNKTFSLYEIMTNITKNYCPQRFVPKFWVAQVVELFHLLHHGDIFKYDNELSDDEYRWIYDILMKCQASKKAINLVPESSQPENAGASLPDGETCNFGTRKAIGYCKKASGECEGEEIPAPPNELYSDYMNKHYVPEVSWLVLDIVHVVCFKEFNESYRMFHLLEQTVEKLFTTQIKNYWFYPTWSDKMKRSMLGFAADDYMWNMEVCAQSAYSIHDHVVHRLIRPDPLKYLTLQKKKRRKRSATRLANTFDVTCAVNKADFQIPDKCENMKVRSKIHKPELIHPGEEQTRKKRMQYSRKETN